MIPSLLNSLAPVRVLATTSPAAVRSWAVGQVLKATVVAVDVDGNTATMLIGDQRVRAQLGGTVNVGQQIALRVVESGERPVLARLQASAAAPTTPESPDTPDTRQLQQQVQQQALRQRLPQAMPLPQLLPALEEITHGEPVRTPSATRATAALQNVLQSLPPLEDLIQPAALKQALQSSGSFLESVLAHAPDQELKQLLARDFKAGLLRIAEMLPQAKTPAGESASMPAPAPPPASAPATTPSRFAAHAAPLAQAAISPYSEATASPAKLPLAQQVHGGVAQIEINQLRTVAEASHGNNVWVIDLPVRERSGSLQLIKLEIDERPARRAGRQVQQWSLSINLDLDPLGPLHARVTLTEAQLHTVIWAERGDTAELIRSHVDWLHAQLRGAGLDAAEIQCLHGRPLPASPAVTAPLVDTRV
jgi:hypothetical protein